MFGLYTFTRKLLERGFKEPFWKPDTRLLGLTMHMLILTHHGKTEGESCVLSLTARKGYMNVPLEQVNPSGLGTEE